MIPNDRLLSISDRNVSVLDAFRQADQVLLSGVQGITDLITTSGLINLDFADVKSVMQGAEARHSWVSVRRGAKTAQSRQPNWLLPRRCSKLPSMAPTASCCPSRAARTSACSKSTKPARLVQEVAHPEANIIFGAVIDDALGDEARVTVIAAGFDEPDVTSKPMAPVAAKPAVSSRPAEPVPASVPETPAPAAPEAAKPAQELPAAAEQKSSFQDLPDVVDSDLNGSNDDLDVPDFLK